MVNSKLKIIKSKNAPTFTAIASALTTVFVALTAYSLFRMFYFRLTYGGAPVTQDLSGFAVLLWISSILALFIIMAVVISVGAWRRQPLAFAAAGSGIILIVCMASSLVLGADLQSSPHESLQGASTFTKVFLFVTFVIAALVVYDLVRLKMFQQLVERTKALQGLCVPLKEARNPGFWLTFLPVGVYTATYLIPNMASVVTGFGSYESYERAAGIVALLGAMFVIAFMAWMLWRLLRRIGRTASLFALAMQCSFALWGYTRLAEHGISTIVVTAVATSYILVSVVLCVRLYKKPVSCYI